MFDLVLRIYEAGGGSHEVVVDGDRVTFGRGSDAEHRFEDSGLSRLHATIYRDGDRVWIVDENSSNGTFVNGTEVAESGMPLEDGDTIAIGHETEIVVSFNEENAYTAAPAAVEAAPHGDGTEAGPDAKPSMLLPLGILAVAVLVIGVSAVVIGMKVLGGGESASASNDPGFEDLSSDGLDLDLDGGNTPDPTTDQPTTAPTADSAGPVPNASQAPITDSPTSSSNGEDTSVTSGKRYQAMTDAEKNQYVKVKAEIVSRVIGNSGGQAIPPAAVAKIRYWLDGYVRRIRSKPNNNCTPKGWVTSDLVSILKRARENAPFIIRAFNEKGIDPQVGLYLAMIESEHCECLQSSTGPLGMFQFTYATGKRHGLAVVPKASVSRPDERCKKEPASRAAASYMKSLTGRIGTGPLSIPLAIASYNSGEGGLGKNLRIALESNQGQDRSFWTLVANSEKLAAQFQRENIKYVPKFFAAAIIGENPKDFGINMLPLSVYTK